MIDYTYGDFVSISVWFCELCLGVACGTQLWGRGLGKHQVSRHSEIKSSTMSSKTFLFDIFMKTYVENYVMRRAIFLFER